MIKINKIINVLKLINIYLKYFIAYIKIHNIYLHKSNIMK